MFPAFKFNQFEIIIETPDGYISRDMFNEIYEKDIHIAINLKRAPKLTNTATYPVSNKQKVSLALSAFDETTSAAIKSYYADRLDAASFLYVFHKIFIISNSKNQFNTPN